MLYFTDINGKKIVADPKVDEKIYRSPCNPPNTGTRYTSGTDLYLHLTKKGKEIYYYHHWSLWQGEESSYRIVMKEDAQEFLYEKLSSNNFYIQPTNLDRLAELGFKFDED